MTDRASIVERLSILANMEGGGPVADALEEAAALIEELVAGLDEARELLLERKQGSPARSAAHNARLVIDALIAKVKPNG